MSSSVRENLIRAMRLALKPLVKLLISQGITVSAFNRAAREVYVEMAVRRQDADQIDVKEIAAVTGISVGEVEEVLQLALETEPQTVDFSAPSRVLSGWHNDSFYAGPYGIPHELPFDQAEDGRSFVELVKQYAPESSPRAMLTALIETGSVVELEKGQYRTVRKDFEPGRLTPELIERMADVIYNVNTTVAANVEKESTRSGLFDRAVFSDNPVTEEELASVKDYWDQKGQQFLETSDIWLSSNIREKPSQEGGKELIQTGLVMVQYAERDSSEKKTLHELLKAIDYKPSQQKGK